MENSGNYSHDTDGFYCGRCYGGAISLYGRESCRIQQQEPQAGNRSSRRVRKSDHPGDEFQLRSHGISKKQEENGGILTYSQTFLTGDGAGAILDTTDAQNVPETPDTDHTAAGADATENTDAVTDGAAADPSLSEQQTDESENAEVTDEEVYGAYVTETEEDIPALREEITDLIDELGTSWNNLYNQYNERISYAVMDPQGGYLRSNVSAPEEIFSRTVADNELQFTVHFDENGRLTVSGVTGLESNCSGLIRSIGRFEFYDPLAARLNNSYRRSGLEFSGPKNMTINSGVSRPSLEAGMRKSHGMHMLMIIMIIKAVMDLSPLLHM